MKTWTFQYRGGHSIDVTTDNITDAVKLATALCDQYGDIWRVAQIP